MWERSYQGVQSYAGTVSSSRTRVKETLTWISHVFGAGTDKQTIYSSCRNKLAEIEVLESWFTFVEIISGVKCTDCYAASLSRQRRNRKNTKQGEQQETLLVHLAQRDGDDLAQNTGRTKYVRCRDTTRKFFVCLENFHVILFCRNPIWRYCQNT